MKAFERKPVRHDLSVLTVALDCASDVIRQFHERGDEGMVEVLTELKADDVLRWQVVDERRALSPDR